MTTTFKPLLTQEDINSTPRLYAQDGQGHNATVHHHLFCAAIDWFITEIDEDGQEAFGYVKFANQEQGELGYISISELNNLLQERFYGANDLRFLIEKDLHWTPKPLKDCIN